MSLPPLNIRGNMIETSINIIRTVLEKYDDHINLQKSIIQAGLNKISIPNLPSEFKNILIEKVTEWVVVPEKYTDADEQVSSLISTVSATISYWEGQDFISKATETYILSKLK